jgi:hypothetical protein
MEIPGQKNGSRKWKDISRLDSLKFKNGNTRPEKWG